MFPNNIGSLDRGIRVAVGLDLIAADASGALGLWAWIGAVPLLTGVFGTCPLYSMIGVNTCRRGS
jgi:hypothetical protein